MDDFDALEDRDALDTLDALDAFEETDFLDSLSESSFTFGLAFEASSLSIFTDLWVSLPQSPIY